MLLEYLCYETAEVNNLKIHKTEEVEEIPGTHVFRYTVSGDIVWPKGCSEFGTGVPPGSKESFDKEVTLYKDEDGNWK